MKQFDNSRPDFSPYGFTCEQWAPARMPRPDRHNEIEVNLLKTGSLSYLLGGQRTTVESGRLAVFWAAVPHQIVGFEGAAPYFVVTLPLSEFLRVGLERSFVNRILHGELLMDVDSDESDEIKFRQWERELGKGDPTSERAARLEVQARLLRFARSIVNRPIATCPSPKLSRADELACYIARNYQQPFRRSADSITSTAEPPNIHHSPRTQRTRSAQPCARWPTSIDNFTRMMFLVATAEPSRAFRG